MHPPTVSEEAGKTKFEFGAGLVFEISGVERSRWGGTNAHLRVTDQSHEELPVIAAGTIRLDDLRERERFCKTLEHRDGKVDDWSAHLLLIADYVSQQEPPASTSTPITVQLSDVEREEVAWLSENRLAIGKLHMFDGDPGVGKSFATDAIIAAITTGSPLFGEVGDRREPAQALMLSAEDGVADTIRPRIEDMGGDLSLVTVLTAVRKENGAERHLSLVDDLAAVEEVLKTGDYAVVVIDPINAYLGGVDTNNDAALRTVLAPIATLGGNYNVAIILVRHLTKSSKDKAIYRGQGSIAYTAACRLAAIVGKNPDDERERVIAWVKNNLGPEAPAIAFSLVEGQFRWLGETDVTAAALVAPEKGPEERNALETAKEFLRETLADGPASATEVEKQAKGVGITHRTLRRAREALGIKPSPVYEDGKAGAQRWDWALPEGLNGQDGQVGKVGHLTPVSYLRPVPQPELGGHLNSSLTGGQEEPLNRNTDDDKRDRCFVSAMAHDFPEITLGLGRKVAAGEEAWTRFVQQRDGGGAIEVAQQALDRLCER